MNYIPNNKPATYQTQRQIRRYQAQMMKKIEKKYGKHLPMPTEDEIGQYIADKTQSTFEWQTEKETSQTN
jgi:hypothetical protein